MPPDPPRLPHQSKGFGKGKVKGKVKGEGPLLRRTKQALDRLARLRWAELEIQARREAFEIQIEALEVEIKHEIQTIEHQVQTIEVDIKHEMQTIEHEVEAQAKWVARIETLRSMNPWRWILIGDV